MREEHDFMDAVKSQLWPPQLVEWAAGRGLEYDMYNDTAQAKKKQRNKDSAIKTLKNMKRGQRLGK